MVLFLAARSDAVSTGMIAGRHFVVFFLSFGCYFLQLVQTSVRTDITVNTGVIAGRHLVVFLVILLCFLAARADVCENRYYSEYWCNRWASFDCFSCHFVFVLVARSDVCENRYYREYWCDRWASFGCSSCRFLAARADVCENRYYSEYWCDRWAELGECDANPDWMYNNCYRSCACTDPGKSSLFATDVDPIYRLKISFQFCYNVR